MPLTWDATKVEGWDAFDDMDSSIMQNYGFVLMAIGIGKVRPENVGEIVFRTRMVQGLVGNLLTGSEPEQVAAKLESVEFVARLVGFYANVADESWTVWSKRVHNIHAGEFQGKARRLLEVVPA